jgi:hypothetical protein
VAVVVGGGGGGRGFQFWNKSWLSIERGVDSSQSSTPAQQSTSAEIDDSAGGESIDSSFVRSFRVGGPVSGTYSTPRLGRSTKFYVGWKLLFRRIVTTPTQHERVRES